MALPYHHVDNALERAIEGHSLSREEAISLMEEGPLQALVEAAAAVRTAFKAVGLAIPRRCLFR